MQKERVEAEKWMPEGSLHNEFFHTDDDDTILHRFSQAIVQGILQVFAEQGLQNLSSLQHQLGKLNMDEKRRVLLQDNLNTAGGCD